VQVKDALRQHFPHVEVNGGNYPTPPMKVMMAQLIQVAQLSFIGLVIAGDYVFTQFLNYPPNGPFPSFYESIREKKMLAGMGAWFVGNSLMQGLTSTGAFEVAFDGQLIHSKLATNQLPSLQHILTQLHRIQPDLISGRHNRARVHSQPSARRSQAAHAAEPEDDSDRVHEMAYDDDNI